MKQLDVELDQRSYPIYVSKGLFDETIQTATAFDQVAIITNQTVADLYLNKITQRIPSNSIKVLIAPDSEQAKSIDVYSDLMSQLLEANFNRSSVLIALGGGVIGDLTGFLAATLHRGCRLIQIPTTLLSQVDSSVGGKTAINHPTGKNLIGSFYQPEAVFIDPATLATLPGREFSAGMAEVIKYGFVSGTGFFDWLYDNREAIKAYDADTLSQMVIDCCSYKAKVVSEDEREQGQRALLNYGHTFGHALEAETGFSDKLLHGEAVALGMVLAARFSARRGEISGQDASRAAIAIGASGLPAEITDLGLSCGGETLVDHMRHDKKMEGSGTLPFLLLKGLGKAYMARDVELSDVAQFLDEELA